jgi:hypothetical protein
MAKCRLSFAVGSWVGRVQAVIDANGDYLSSYRLCLLLFCLKSSPSWRVSLFTGHPVSLYNPLSEPNFMVWPAPDHARTLRSRLLFTRSVVSAHPGFPPECRAHWLGRMADKPSCALSNRPVSGMGMLLPDRGHFGISCSQESQVSLRSASAAKRARDFIFSSLT